MNDRIKENSQSALFRKVKGTVFSDGDYTYQVSVVYYDDIDEEDIQDIERLKNRLKKKVQILNKRRIEVYNLNLKPIDDSTPLELKKFKIVKEESKASSGKYALFPLEFICSSCGKYRKIHSYKELDQYSQYCKCGGKMLQNTIVTFCSSCGKISDMGLRCSTHGEEDIYVERPQHDNIQTWKKKCKKCNTTEPIYFNCPVCHHNSVPLTIRDGGVVNPVVYTFVDLPKIMVKTDVDVVRYAIDQGLFRPEMFEKDLGDYVHGKAIDEIISDVESAASNPLSTPSESVLNAKKLIDSVKHSIKNSFSDDSIESINDVNALVRSSKKLRTVASDHAGDEYGKIIKHLLDKFRIEDIHLVKNLHLTSSCVGIINGINKFYDPNYVPHFDAFWKNKDKNEINAIVNKLDTEGILIKLNEIEVYNWLSKNDFVKSKISNEEKIEHIHHLSDESPEFVHIQTLLHTLSHALIRQSSLHTGLDYGTCSELIFVNNCSILIYSTSTVNIGGFEYLFNYSIPDLFREVEDAVYNCTFDPICKEDGGRCFSCMYLEEHVCVDFNRNLSRLSLIGGGPYPYGYWE